MKLLKYAFFAVLVCSAVFVGFQVSAENPAMKEYLERGEEEDQDVLPGTRIDKEDYLKQRQEQIDWLRGLDTAKPDSRGKAITEMQRSEDALERRRRELNQPLDSLWVPIGPSPIPVNASTSYSGRISAIAVHPTNPNIVYVGAAQGGVYRSLNGGAVWTPIMDDALSISIGSIAILPSDPSTIFVGTGEPAFSGDSFFGVGIYRITNADTTPVLSGPLNLGAGNADVFTGRSVSKIVVHPTNPNVLFATTVTGIAGIGGTTSGATLPTVGLFRTSNALAASPTFEKLTVSSLNGGSRRIVDAVIEPDNPNRMIVSLVDSEALGDGGIYLSTNALDAVPIFTRTQATGTTTSTGRAELAIQKTGSTVTVYAATGVSNGTLYKSVDGGATFTPAIANNFCNPQCFYDIAVAVDPTNANNVYLGGSPTLVFGRSSTGGTSFTSSSSGLHVDTHAIAVAPSDPNTIYFGSDGGIWKSVNGGVNWTTLNNSTISATQFQGIALHPTDRNYSLGGTQDNGTQYYAPNGSTWVRSDGGDGGFAVIDQNSTSPNETTAYHTYYNSSGSQIGFTRAFSTVTGTTANGDPNWTGFLGCGGTANGINCADATLFYAPMVGGPGSPNNTLYFGTTNLYRSADRGTTMTSVSGTLPARISAIAISPQDDNIRLVGLTTGAVYLSTAPGSTTMNNVSGSIPGRYVGRVAIDPTNANIAYVALNGFGLAAGQHVWKTTNLLSGSPTWTASGSGIPDVPTNAFVVDPSNPNTLFAGTDIGVFRSDDGGASWNPFSNGLPRVAVFGMELQNAFRVLRIATHGRGMYQYNLRTPVRRAEGDFDGDGKSDPSVYRPSIGTWFRTTSSNGGTLINQFGISTDSVTPGDFDGDSRTDLAVYRNGVWFVLNSSNSVARIEQFGIAGDSPVANDYDGDGKADLSVYRNGVWYVHRTSDFGYTIQTFGLAGDVPVPSDFDGDGKADFAVFRPSDSPTDADFYVLKTSDLGVLSYSFGGTGDVPVVGDYDGDSLADVAVWRPSNGVWYMSGTLSGIVITQFGLSDDIPSRGDYDGDGKTDPAVFRPSNGRWYVMYSSTGVPGESQFGVNGDVPIPGRQNH